MQAIRTRGACIARQTRAAGLRQAPRRHAHDHHHHHVEPVNESIGAGFWGTVAVIPAFALVYNLSTPDKDGKAPWLTRKIHEYHSWQEEWAERSHLHTKAIEQAGFDRALFLHAPVNRDVDLRFPEAVHNHAARNIPAGHIANMDHVVEHYRKKKTAWTDCVDLYDQIITRLNRTADRCSPVDAQTWLSAALTALETCRTGFEELGVSAFGYSLTANNVSKLISDGLSVNKPPSPEGYEPQTMAEGFPTWVRPGDRKLLQAGSPKANVVVAKDGSGNFQTVKEAVAAAKGGGRFVIYVKAGVYSENVEIKAKNVMLIGDGIGKTVITGSRSVGGGSTTFRSATVAVDGDGFIARDITFRNTAGAKNHQAVALRSGSDLSVFYRCGFEGFQDTLYVYAERQFYKQCDIYGTVDFIFGNAAVVIQDSNIIARDPPNKTITLTAQGRTDPNQNTGISIHNCRVTSAGGLSGVKAYLGRPWKQYSRTVFMKSSIGGFISPAGWMEWSGNFALNTLYYGEYMNTGPGASTANRVKWKGYHVITSAAEASKFTVGNFIAGGSWLPSTGVPFTSGL